MGEGRLCSNGEERVPGWWQCCCNITCYHHYTFHTKVTVLDPHKLAASILSRKAPIVMIQGEGEHRISEKQRCKQKGTTNAILELKGVGLLVVLQTGGQSLPFSNLPDKWKAWDSGKKTTHNLAWTYQCLSWRAEQTFMTNSKLLASRASPFKSTEKYLTSPSQPQTKNATEIWPNYCANSCLKPE